MFDPSKPVQTRDGRKARIICTDAKRSDTSIVALVEDEATFEYVMDYHTNGQIEMFSQDKWDLINIEKSDEHQP